MQIQLFHIFIIAIFFSNIAYSNETTIDYENINNAIVENVILPDYDLLERASTAFKQEIHQACRVIPGNDSRVSEKQLPILQKSFLELRHAWAKIQLINFGPISFVERRERFDYWPDKHRVGEKQLRRLLNDKEPINWTLEVFREKSVAIQGLSAMERLVFSKNIHWDDNRCQLAKLISSNMMEIATQVSSQWSKEPIEFKNDLLKPSPDLTFFTSSKEVSSVLLNDVSTQLRFISDIKIAKALPKKGKETGNYRQLESWRTDSSFSLMKTNILTTKEYYQRGFSIQIIKFKPDLHQQIISLFDSAINIVQILNSESQVLKGQLLTQQSNLNKLRELQSIVLDIDMLLKNNVVNTLGLNIKFNALDGD